MIAFIWIGACIVLAVVAQYMMKVGMGDEGKIGSTGELFSPSRLLSFAANKYVVIGVLSYALSALFWLGALSNLDVSLAYPLISLSYVLVAIIGAFVLKENVNVFRWLGILMILGGVVVITKFQ